MEGGSRESWNQSAWQESRQGRGLGAGGRRGGTTTAAVNRVRKG